MRKHGEVYFNITVNIELSFSVCVCVLSKYFNNVRQQNWWKVSRYLIDKLRVDLFRVFIVLQR